MPSDLIAAGPASRTCRRGAPGWLVGVGVTLLLLGLVLLVLPTSTHQDVPDVGEDIFFDCGGGLYPGARPAEEPGVSACRDVNDSMVRWGLGFVAGGTGMAFGGVLLHRRLHLQRP
jgi:hypothetical protein